MFYKSIHVLQVHVLKSRLYKSMFYKSSPWFTSPVQSSPRSSPCFTKCLEHVPKPGAIRYRWEESCQLVLVGDFNLPDIDWSMDFPSPTSQAGFKEELFCDIIAD